MLPPLTPLCNEAWLLVERADMGRDWPGGGRMGMVGMAGMAARGAPDAPGPGWSMGMGASSLGKAPAVWE